MAGWQDFAAPVDQAAPPQLAADDATPAWISLAAPAPAEPEFLSAPKLSTSEKVYQNSAENGGLLGRIHSALGGFTDQLTRALTMGLSDKAAALAPATVHEVARGINGLHRALGNEAPFPEADNENFGDIYHRALEAERNAGTRYAEDHRIASKVATVGGTLASIPVMSAEAPIVAAPTLAGRALQGATAGATVGGMAGFGQSNDESLAKDATNVATGAGLGAATGGALSTVAAPIAQRITDWVARKLGPEAAENQAVRAIAQRIEANSGAGGPTAQDMLDLVNAARASGKPVMLADVGGEGVQGMAERIANTPGAGRQALVQALSTRDAGAGSRLAGDVTEHLGAGGTTFDTARALMEARSTAAAPLYERALATEAPVTSDRLQQFLSDPVFKKGLSQGIQIQRLEALAEGRPFNPSDYAITGFNEGGDPILGAVPNMRTLDAAKKGLDNILDQYRDPTTGRLALDQTGRAIDQVRRAYLGELDRLNPDYAAARAAYSGPSQSLEALKRGADFAGKSPEQIRADIAALPAGDQEFYRLGAANALKTQIAKTSSGGNEARRIVGNDYVQQQIRALSPSDEAAQKLIDAATTEHKMFETGTKLLGNSRTAIRQAEQASHAGEEGGMAGALGQTIAGAATGEPVVSGLGAFKLAQKLYGALARPSSVVDTSVAKLLSSSDPAQNQRVLAQIMAASRRPSYSVPATVPLASLMAEAYPSLTRLPFTGGSASP